VRGICCLRPGVPGVSEKIRVSSVVDRFLEHTRVFAFGAGDKPEVYLSSADWMPRNFERRVEAVAPVEDPTLHPRLRSLLRVCLEDNRQAWDLGPDGLWTQRVPEGAICATHEILLRDAWGITRDDRISGRTDEHPRISLESLRDASRAS
jgi:polyphosphate kinase